MISQILRKNITEVLASIAYEKAILFGSRARGDSTEQSDFDLLVVLGHTNVVQEKIQLATHLRKLFAEQLIDVDVIVKDKNEIEYLKDKAGSIVRNALREGISL